MSIRYGNAVMTSAVLSGMYLLAIMPRMIGKADPAPFNTRLFAHRGLYNNDSDAPENSMAAFRKAVESGYGIELDVQLTADRVPVIFHDFDLQRVCGVRGNVRDFTYRELQKFRLFHSSETIPALKDFLAMVNGKVPLIVEYKSEDADMTLCRIIDPMLRAYKGIYCIESFNPLVLMWYRLKRPGVMRGQLSDGFSHKPLYRTLRYAPATIPVQFLIPNFLSKPDFIAYNHLYERNISRRICRYLYRGRAAAWTIKSQEQLDRASKAFDVFIFESFVPKIPQENQRHLSGTELHTAARNI